MDTTPKQGQSPIVPLKPGRAPRRIKSALLASEETYVPSRNINQFRAGDVFAEASYPELKKILQKDDLDALLRAFSIRGQDIAKYEYHLLTLPKLVWLFTNSEFGDLKAEKKPPTCARLKKELEELYAPLLADHKDSKIQIVSLSFIRELASNGAVDHLLKENEGGLIALVNAVALAFKKQTVYSRSLGESALYDFNNILNFLGERNIERLCMEHPEATLSVFPWIAFMMAYYDQDTGIQAQRMPRPEDRHMNALLIIELLGRDLFMEAFLKNPFVAIAIVDSIQEKYFPVSAIEKLAKGVEKDVAKLLALLPEVERSADPQWLPKKAHEKFDVHSTEFEDYFNRS